MEKNYSVTENSLVSVVIINYNGKEYILDCINSVFKTTNCNFEVLLIDNNSSDNSSESCKEKYPEIRLFRNKKNLAMAARNKGIDEAKGDFLVFLDADTVVEPNWLSILLDSYKKHGIGMYQGRFFKRNDHSIIENCGCMTNIFGTGFARDRGQKNNNQFEKFQKISFATGACTFSAARIFREIGYVDESSLFFLMADDLDYGWRGWMLGIPSYYEPQCIIYHVGSPNLGWNSEKFFFMERNRWICLLTLYSEKTLFKIFPFLILYDFCMFLFLSSKRMGFVKVRAFFSLLKMLPKIQKRKKLMQSKRKFQDHEVVKNFVNTVDIPVGLTSDSPQFFTSFIKKLNIMTRQFI